MRSTWYDLEDGSTVDPNECAPDRDGTLRHKSGVAVKLRNGAPHSRGVDLDNPPEAPKSKGKAAAVHKQAEADDGTAPAPTAEQQPAEKPKRGRKPGSYNTRESKAEK